MRIEVLELITYKTNSKVMSDHAGLIIVTLDNSAIKFSLDRIIFIWNKCHSSLNLLYMDWNIFQIFHLYFSLL